MTPRLKTALIVVVAAVVLAGVVVGGIALFTSGKATGPESGTAAGAPSSTVVATPTVAGVAVTSNEQGVVRPDDVADQDERGYLHYLDNNGVKYPASFAALVAGRGAAPYVCPYYGAKQGTRDGRLIIDILQRTPEWAKSSQTAFSEAVLYTMCDGTAPRR